MSLPLTIPYHLFCPSYSLPIFSVIIDAIVFIWYRQSLFRLIFRYLFLVHQIEIWYLIFQITNVLISIGNGSLHILKWKILCYKYLVSSVPKIILCRFYTISISTFMFQIVRKYWRKMTMINLTCGKVPGPYLFLIGIYQQNCN